jgi:hypothetical protein
MTDPSSNETPPRIARMVESRLPASARTAAFWRRVEAELLPTFRPEITSPLYDDWLALHLEYIYRTDQRRPRPAVYHRITARAGRLLTTLEATIATSDMPAEKAQATALHSIIEDQRREWMTDFYAPVLDRPNWRFLNEAIRRAESLPGDDPDADEPKPGSRSPKPLFDRLPVALMAFVNREFASRKRDGQFWNRLRDDVSPHFRETWLESPEYCDFLRLLIRFHGFRETTSLTKDVRAHLDELESATKRPEDRSNNTFDGEGIPLGLIRSKTEDLMQAIEEYRRKGRPPAPSPAPSAHDR